MVKANKNIGQDYVYVYNKGFQNRIIFRDSSDYNIFIKYLREYLTLNAKPETNKKEFVIKGKVFQGVPHLPKNYYNKVKLIAYSLKTTSFHLVLEQLSERSIGGFIKSLCVRYSIYFNKKYGSKGALLDGPYKIKHIDNTSNLHLLIRQLHKNNHQSSYQEYIVAKQNGWITPIISQKIIEERGGNYQNFITNYTPTETEIEILRETLFENEIEPIAQILTSKPKFILITTVGALTIFFILFGFGIRNINAYNTRLNTPTLLTKEVLSDNSQISQEETVVEKPTSEDTISTSNKIMVIIRIKDGSESINIRQEPSTKSEIIGKARDGDSFEYISRSAGWYEIKLSTDQAGFISTKYGGVQHNEND